MASERSERVPRGVHFCCVCQCYRGKVIGDRKVSLHRFPLDAKLSKVWKQRVLTVIKAGFKLTGNSRLCSEHFVGKAGPTPYVTLPSLFSTKEFKQTNLFDCHMDPKMGGSMTGMVKTTGSAVLVVTTSKEAEDNNVADVAVEMEPTAVEMGVQTDSIYLKKTSTGMNTNILSFRNAATQTCDVATTSAACETNRPPFTFEDIANDDAKVMFYTGFPTAKSLQVVFDELSHDEAALKLQIGCRKVLRYIDEFFLVLMRIRLGLLLEDLADRFCVSSATCSTIFTRWIHFLSINLYPLIHWPSRQQVDQMMPWSFRMLFPKCRILVDCTELFTKRSSSLVTQSLSYSHYKSAMTWKGLIGITPNGILSFVSDLWLGSISDQQMTSLTKLLDLLEPNDAIMADKGFDIAKYTTARQIDLIIPPKRNKQRKMNASEIILTRRIARLRIHVERYMAVLKKFRILEQGLADTSQPNDIWKVCNALTMLYAPLNP